MSTRGGWSKKGQNSVFVVIEWPLKHVASIHEGKKSFKFEFCKFADFKNFYLLVIKGMKKSHYFKVWVHCLRQLSQKLLHYFKVALFEVALIKVLLYLWAHTNNFERLWKNKDEIFYKIRFFENFSLQLWWAKKVKQIVAVS